MMTSPSARSMTHRQCVEYLDKEVEHLEATVREHSDLLGPLLVEMSLARIEELRVARNTHAQENPNAQARPLQD